jgi:5-methyltetrahydropteroyltriglutamate--homocysteine methyltransferase
LALPKHVLPTTVVGSYPQPDWLADRQMLSKSVPRTRMTQMWRIPDA